MKPQVIFYTIQNSREKLKKITEISYNYFLKKEPFLIFVADAKALSYLDDFLWSYPQEGFFPHTPSNQKTTDIVTITTTRENLNHAKFILNLCPSPLLFDPPIQKIYEFEDLSSPIKQNFSQTRFRSYRQAGYSIESGY